MAMYRNFIALGLLLLSTTAQAQLTSPHWPLKQVFGKHAAVLQMAKQAVAEVCVGEVCTRFVVRDPKGLEIVHDFAYLYFWMVEGYDIAPNKTGNSERFVVTILNRRKGQCTGTDEEALGRCALAQMAKSYVITGLESKPENGWNKTFKLDIPAKLKAAGVIQ